MSTRYIGRSFGRMIEFLDRYCGGWRAHECTFENDGSITFKKEPFISKVEWDDFDAPTFHFEGKGKDCFERNQTDQHQEMLDLEHDCISFSAPDTEQLRQVASEPIVIVGEGRPPKVPDNLEVLQNLGLVTTERVIDRNRSKEGWFVNSTLSITPEGRGFLSRKDSNALQT